MPLDVDQIASAIDGEAFVYIDNDTARITTILNYNGGIVPV